MIQNSNNAKYVQLKFRVEDEVIHVLKVKYVICIRHVSILLSYVGCAQPTAPRACYSLLNQRRFGDGQRKELYFFFLFSLLMHSMCGDQMPNKYKQTEFKRAVTPHFCTQGFWRELEIETLRHTSSKNSPYDGYLMLCSFV